MRLIKDDCLNLIPTLKDKSVNMVITSPPYNVDLGNNKYKKDGYNIYQDNKDHKDYINWLKSVFKALYSKMTDDGRVAINIGDGKNGSIPTHSDVINLMTEIGYKPYTTIIWNKSQVGNRTAWGSFKSPSSPSFPTPFEYILVFYKKHRKLQHKGITDIEKQEFIDWSLAIWNFAPETRMKKIGHPAMFPVELPRRLLKLFTYQEDVVFDPFMGAGTVGVACKTLNRKFIGTEIDKTYYNIAKDRIEGKLTDKEIKEKYKG
jgi:site-specific DNA-methyltransferase (adenine-specific)